MKNESEIIRIINNLGMGHFPQTGWNDLNLNSLEKKKKGAK